MSHYDFSRMGWQQFEHMVQALASAELGNGLTVFGSGRDGQREATWNGRVTFPVGRQLWNGRGVLQAKYKERTTSTPESAWFMAQIKHELDGWLNKRRLLAAEDIPQYYLFASNASLSGVETVGGKDQFESLIETYRKPLGLRDAVAWDYNQLRTLIDNHPMIRQTYLEQIVPGDFLTGLDERLPHSVVVTAERLAANAATELTRKQYAKVSDVGFPSGARFKLADIGIDLPGQIQGQADAYTPDLEEVSVAEHVVGLADNVHRPRPSGADASGVLLVGGPGQGKSTISQLLAHIYRVTFLQDAGTASFGPIADAALTDLKLRFTEAGFRHPIRRRWPFVVDLAVLNQYTAGLERPNIMAYIAENVRVDGGSLTPPQLLDWLAAWPCLLLLDGLDEVPNADDRERLVASIHEFVVQTRVRGVDLFTVVTTRPQGYANDMNDALKLSLLVMRELNDAEALDYADALMKARAPEDEEEQLRVTNRLLEAVADKTAGRLMRTPLQVSIMTALAERAVALPQTRHELFDAYYSVIYDRERVKTSETTILTNHRAHIDYLHEQVGLSLEIASEKWHNSDAALHRNAMEKILSSRLRDIGYDKYQSKEITFALMRATTDRLVLLVAKGTGDQFAFEVRTLQEYMAARALTAGTDEQVRTTLDLLYKSMQWRNTYLLAVGRLVSDRPVLGDQVIKALVAADLSDDEQQIILSGAEASADLFLDGVGLAYPNMRRSLLTAAMRLLADTSDDIPRRVRLIVRELMSPEADPGEWHVVQQALLENVRKNRSSVAALILSSWDDPGKKFSPIKRSLLGDRFAYERPRARSIEDRQFMLGVRLAGIVDSLPEPTDAVRQVIAMFEYVETLEQALMKADDSGYTSRITSAPVPEPQNTDESSVRRALVQVVHNQILVEPDIAYHATTLLRANVLRRSPGAAVRSIYPEPY
jgi:hypothetical protein